MAKRDACGSPWLPQTFPVFRDAPVANDGTFIHRDWARSQMVSIAKIFGERDQYSEETKVAIRKIVSEALLAHRLTPKEGKAVLKQLEPISPIKPASQGGQELVDVYRTIGRQGNNLTGVFHAVVYPRDINGKETGFKQVFTSTDLNVLPRFKDAVRDYIKTSAQPKNDLPGFRKFKGGVVSYVRELVLAISTAKAIARQGATLAEQEQGEVTKNYYLGQLKQFLQQKLAQITPEELTSLFTDTTVNGPGLPQNVSMFTYASSVSALSDAVSFLRAEDREKYRGLLLKCHDLLVDGCNAKSGFMT